jgi:nuclear pore complex protein Nup155
MKGARIMEFDKLREVIGDYQQLDFAKGAVELALYCAEALDADCLGKEYWQTVPPVLDGQGRSNNAPDDPRRLSWERRARCYDLVLDSLESFENKAASGDDVAERVRAHAYEIAFASADEIFHSRLYEWLISRGLADELLEVRNSHFYRAVKLEASSLCRCVHHTCKRIFNASQERSTSISYFGSSTSKTANPSAPPKYLLL